MQMILNQYINKRINKIAPSHDFYLYCINIANITHTEYLEHFANLNSAEALRAQEYASFKLASEFTTCRSLCKHILADALNLKPKSINFLYSDKGKPYLENYPIHFNISHSNEYALIAIANKNIGVDIEYMNKDIEIEELMKIFAYDHEIKWILENRSLSIQRFYTIWTLKEAILKQQGEGITAEKFPSLINLDFPGYKLYKNTLHSEYAYALCLSNN
jgi:4'-phosphopantetheinyl transferase